MFDLSLGLLSAITEALRVHPRMRRWILFGSSICLVIIVAIWVLRSLLFAPAIAAGVEQVATGLIAVFAIALLFSVASYSPVRFGSGTFEFYREKIAEAESRVEAEPGKVKPAWDLARVTLEAYFNRNLSQISSIFWLSVVVMLVGFGIIIWGVSQAIQSPDAVAPAAIASAVGVITEFIGATFLFIYRSAIQQGMIYSKTLERINAVGMAMQILDTIPDATGPDDLKSKTKASMVELLIRQTHDAARDDESRQDSSKS